MLLTDEIYTIILKSPFGIKNSEIREQLKVVTNERQVRAEITKLRERGFPICADTNGYFLPRHEKDYLDSILRLARQIDTMKRTVYTLSNGLFEQFGRVPIISDEEIKAVHPNELTPSHYPTKLELIKDLNSFLQYESNLKKQ